MSLNPTNTASSKPLTGGASLKSAGTFTYTRPTTTLTSLTYTIWTSTSPRWTRDTGAAQTVASTVDNVQTVNVRLISALLSRPNLFVRVQAEP
jgi:hypothetical protein